MTEDVRYTQLGNEQVMFVLVKTTWTAPDSEPSLHFQIITAARTTDLEELRQTIQDDFEIHAQQDHPGSSMIVEVYDADDVPDGVVPDGAEVTSLPEVFALAEAISTRATTSE